MGVAFGFLALVTVGLVVGAFAIGLSIVTMRLLFVPAPIIVASPTDAPSTSSFAAVFVADASVMEASIRATLIRVYRTGTGMKAA